MNLEKNAIVQVEIDGYSAEGAGVCHIDGFAVFVPGAARGDVCLVRILKLLPRYGFGKIEKLLIPSPCRTEPDCAVYPRCGGCTLRHVTYEEELRLKEERVRDTLRRIGGVEPPLEGILPAPRLDGCRNKGQFPVGGEAGRIVTGFYRVNSHDIVPADNCPVQSEAANRLVSVARAHCNACRVPPYDENSRSGQLRHICVRVSETTGEALLCLVTAGEGIPRAGELAEQARQAWPGLQGVLLNRNPTPGNAIYGKEFRILWGRDYIEDAFGPLVFRVHMASFYQVNPQQMRVLYDKVREYLFSPAAGEPAPPKIGLLLDLYCGAGTIGLYLAASPSEIGGVERLVGVELVPEAVEDARRNARDNGIENAEFFCEDAAAAAKRMAAQGLRPDAVVVDPPRKGLDPAALEAVVRMQPQRVVYVSCDPATLARDLRLFAQNGYPAQQACAVDMFPRTGHVETVVLMSRVKD